ncbi:hypothetical protein AZH09_RS14975 [Acinetobacter baumannii]|uniref:hypothetical protein n=1 Tax=Acinetobacter baumannii TaxID=470 RepID=UPI000A3C5542|nr:hypothetical protein [Acinetobacter baumannii]EHU1236680.1 hypothetical protein [Acinetobacter baumannii]EHU2204265.1 hypothetical protein [Acinetobacter baumannii]EHU2220459.1 hypothetical protein [Acinetobacter baumannii]EHU2392739.1 hypothetical protein [Acinetobacter baumannii]EHU2599200.1 hypothetical protein [Acinetobacter baumannii]
MSKNSDLFDQIKAVSNGIDTYETRSEMLADSAKIPKHTVVRLVQDSKVETGCWDGVEFKPFEHCKHLLTVQD